MSEDKKEKKGHSGEENYQEGLQWENYLDSQIKVWQGILSKIRKKLEEMERRKSKGVKNNGNNKEEGGRDRTGKLGNKGVDRRRWQWNGEHLWSLLWVVKNPQNEEPWERDSVMTYLSG